ncbi:MAG: dTMP kinase [Candidatus Omnitrophica bacterium]|nr:dTMP kinase [Candidatus Omnitrophota bacterium]
MFITFEGPEGCGKSTHSRRLFDEMTSDGMEVVHTAEPGGTELGARIRDILLEKKDIRLGEVAELLLFEADRAQHVAEVIRPALEEGGIVLCDRFNTATFAYQGYGLGMDMDLVKRVDRAATGGLEADLTVLMDVDVETGLKRAGAYSAGDRMEKRAVSFHRKVRDAYLRMAGDEPGRFIIIRVSDDIEQTYKAVREAVYGYIERNKGTG